MQNKTLLISIRPEYARLIFNGTKRVELRRVRPQLDPGDTVLVYITSPVKALSGQFVVDRVECSDPETLWESVSAYAGISYSDFRAYYNGTDKAYAIFVDNASILTCPVGLERLRDIWHDFRPPQCYVYITKDQIRKVAVNIV